jgi:hypothetical protein
MAVQYTPTAILSPADGHRIHWKKIGIRKATSSFFAEGANAKSS